MPNLKSSTQQLNKNILVILMLFTQCPSQVLLYLQHELRLEFEELKALTAKESLGVGVKCGRRQVWWLSVIPQDPFLAKLAPCLTK